MEEIEAKFINIDPEVITAKLVELGAEKEFTITYRISTFDYPDLRLNGDSAWVRLRDEGKDVRLAFKQRLGVVEGQNDAGTLEHEVVVSDFETTANILRSIGLTEKFQEEKRRTRWRLNGVEVDIDEVPMLQPYLEIEAKSWDDVDKTASLLELNFDDKKICSTFQLYEFAGINMLDYRVLTFDRQVKR